ncbi:hypothetical protein RRG08_057059 [Elysia crispata]|uniref:Uncharacterized protein n=1 Tax=Elysia crispata TaxID=231223 RepID=A0AAE0ZRV2_9GAST|nr:hypothetical protein RRG08_057059 [Elysia crispata]
MSFTNLMVVNLAVSEATTLCWRPVTGTGVLLGTAARFRFPLLRGHDVVLATRYRDRCPPRNSRPFPLPAPPRPRRCAGDPLQGQATTLCWRPVTGTGVLLGTAARFRFPLLRGHDVVLATRYRDRCPPRNSRPSPLTAPPRPHDVVLATRYRDREGARLPTTKTLRLSSDLQSFSPESSRVDSPCVVTATTSSVEPPEVLSSLVKRR